MLQGLPDATAAPRATNITVLQFIAFILAIQIGALMVLSLRWEIFHDASLMYFIGRDIANGAKTVTDVFDMNMPLVHWMHAAIYSVFGLNYLAWRILDLAVLGSVCFAGFKIVQPIAGQFAVGAVIWLLALHNFSGPWIVGQRDVMMLAMVLFASLAMIRVAERGLDPRCSIAAGFLLGLAIMLKPTAVMFPPVLLAALFLSVQRLRSMRAAAIELTLIAGGGAIPCFAVLAALWWQGILPDFVELWTQYLIPAYGRVRFGFATHLEPLLSVGIPAIAIFAYAAFTGVRMSAGPRVCIVGAVALGSLFGYIAQGKGWSYQAAPFNYSLILLTAVVAEKLWQVGEPQRRITTGLVAAAAAWPILVLSALFLSSLEAARTGDDWPPPATSAMMQDLDNLIDRGRPVQVMDTTDGAIDALLRTGRRQPTRFIYDFQFYIGEQTAYRARLREEFLARLEAAGEHALLVTNQQWPGNRGFDRVDDPRLWPELNRLITTKYKLVAERSRDLPHGKQYRIYRYDP